MDLRDVRTGSETAMKQIEVSGLGLYVFVLMFATQLATCGVQMSIDRAADRIATAVTSRQCR